MDRPDKSENIFEIGNLLPLYAKVGGFKLVEKITTVQFLRSAVLYNTRNSGTICIGVQTIILSCVSSKESKLMKHLKSLENCASNFTKTNSDLIFGNSWIIS